MGEGLKEIDSGLYPKGPNSWIYNTCFKPLLTHTHFLIWD